MKNNIKFYIPFEGFYCSIYDDIINDIIYSEIEEGYLNENEADKIDYSNLHLQLSEHIFYCILELLNDEFNLFADNNYIKFDGLYSPKYYNYSNDKIEAICSPEIYLKLLNCFEKNEDFINYVNEASKTRSGFISFYEGINEIKKEPSIFLEYLFKWFVLDEYRNKLINFSTDNIHEIIYNNI